MAFLRASSSCPPGCWDVPLSTLGTARLRSSSIAGCGSRTSYWHVGLLAGASASQPMSCAFRRRLQRAFVRSYRSSRYSVIANWISDQKPFRPPVGRIVVARARAVRIPPGALQRYSSADRSCAALAPIGRHDSRRRPRPGWRWKRLRSPYRMYASPVFSSIFRNSINAPTSSSMPSMGPEGLPMTSLEAMAHGLPCIFSDLPVHHEITDHGKGAYLFRSGEVESL